MRTTYSIFQVSGYVLESFHGRLIADQLFKFVDRQQRDARMQKHYHTLSDYTQAKPNLSVPDINRLADILYSSSQARNGRHALVLVDARSYAFATVFQTRIAQAGIDAKCFGRRDAALHWLLATSTLPPGPPAANSFAHLTQVSPEMGGLSSP